MAPDPRPDMAEFETIVSELLGLMEEKNRLMITEPGSRRLKILDVEIEFAQVALERNKVRSKEKFEEFQEAEKRREQLTFDVQRQLTTLSATLIVALLALSEVFENTAGLRDAVGGASAYLAYSLAASMSAMLLSTVSDLDTSIFEEPDDAPRRKRFFGRSVIVAGRVLTWLGYAAAVAGFSFFFYGLFSLAAFLSRG